MQQSGAKRASIALGVFLAVVMIAGVFAPYVQQLFANSATTDTTVPTPTVVATFPPPPSNLDAITFDKVYLHPSGIFSIAQPDGWSSSQPNMGSTIAQVNMINNDLLVVVDSYIEDVPLTADKLSDYFNQQVIANSWSNFTTWQESSRQMVGNNLQIDFTVTLSGQTYVARQTVWTDGTWVYVVRVLVPENATDLLRYLLDNFTKSLQPQTEFKGTPFDWNAYYDSAASHIIRYPSDWAVTDSAMGRPTSISSTDGGIRLRVEARANTTIADDKAASAFIQSVRSGATVMSVQPVTRGLGQGFSVSYSYTTVDGSKQSGLTVLLNGPDNQLHIADLQFPASNLDLNKAVLNAPAASATAEATAQATPEATADANVQNYLLLAQVMSTFNVIQPLNLSAQSLPQTPTVVAPVQTEEALPLTLSAPTTAEATGAVTAASTSAVTEAATAVPPPLNIPVSPTGEGTSAPATSIATQQAPVAPTAVATSAATPAVTAAS